MSCKCHDPHGIMEIGCVGSYSYGPGSYYCYQCQALLTEPCKTHAASVNNTITGTYGPFFCDKCNAWYSWPCLLHSQDITYPSQTIQIPYYTTTTTRTLGIESCRKCGSAEYNLWHAPENTAVCFGKKHPKHEHLDVTCKTCGFGYWVDCLDARNGKENG